MSRKVPPCNVDGPFLDQTDGRVEHNYTVDTGSKHGIFSQALCDDGALTWDVPPKLDEEGVIPSAIEGTSPIVFDNVRKAHRRILDPAYSQHLSEIVDQLLKGEGVSNPDIWKQIIIKLANDAAELLSPQLANQKGALDPRQLVQVEVLPDQEAPSDSFVGQGVVIRKSVAHKGMQSKLKNPKVLLLAGALELETSKVETINTLVQQELAFLASAVAIISSCKPDLLVVERNVARFAIQSLESKGIALVYNVALDHLQKLALNLGTQVVDSISCISSSTLGECGDFNVNIMRNTARPAARTRRARIPPLMKFTECPNKLSCFVILKGEPQDKLDILARIVSMATCVAYHHRLESAFLTDELTCALTSLAPVTEGFPPEVDMQQLRAICRAAVADSIDGVRMWRPGPRTTSMSPHIAGWSAEESRSPIDQSKSYCIPVFDPLSQKDSPREDVALRSEPTLSCLGSSFMQCLSDFLDQNPDIFNDSSLSSTLEATMDSQHSMGADETIPATTAGIGQESVPLDRRSSGDTVYGLARGTSISSSAAALESDDAGRHQGSSEATQRHEELLRIYTSQKFTSNFANRNHRKGLLCEPAHVQTMDFYGENDCSLETFLMSIAADATKRCPQGCGGGNSSHVRTFLHGGMRLTVSVVSLPVEKELPGDGQLWFWARPKGIQSEPLASIHRTLLSQDGKCLSLGQFLDLSCNARYLSVLDRQLHLEFVRYFGYGRTVACVYQDRIRPYSISLPSLKSESGLQSLVHWLKDGHAELGQESTSAYYAIEESLNFPVGDSEDLAAIKKATKSRWLPQIRQQHEHYRDNLNRIICRVCNGAKISESLVLNCILDLNQQRRQLAVNLLTWSAKLQDPSMYFVELNTHGEDRSDTPFLGIGAQLLEVVAPERSQSIGAEIMLPSAGDGLESPRDSSLKIGGLDAPEGNPLSSPWSPFSSGNRWDDFKYENAVENLSETGNFTDDSGRKFISPFAALIDRPFSPDSSWSARSQDSLEARASFRLESFGIDSSLERLPAMSPDLDKSLFSGAIRQNSSSGYLNSLLDHEAMQFVEDRRLSVDGNARHRRWLSDPLLPVGTSLLEQLGRRLTKVDEVPFYNAPPEQLDGSMSKPKSDPLLRVTPQIRHLLKPGAIPLANGIFQMNGRSLVTSAVDDVVIPFFDAEPASIIAHVLASFAYQKDLQVGIEGIVASCASTAPSDGKITNESTLYRNSILLSKEPVHLVQKFEDDPPGMPWSQAKFQVVAYYAPQFSKLRDLCISGGEQSFIMSLSRCKRWETQGGKSNAYFSKTKDDRYIIKSLSKPEKICITESFGPAYFEHMSEALEEDRRVALAKILGVFQVSMKSNPDFPSDNPLGKDWTQDVIVMENVFYNRNMDRTYDLKGSGRTRFNSEAEENPSDKGAVYLDSNLRKHNLSAPPLLVDKASLEGLTLALQRDSHFLAGQWIMDYSLLVGLDKDNSTLVVAIIDYVRKYTWDKRLESLAKSSGIIGGKADVGEEPTVIPPDLYMRRFVSTITSYFHVVPTSDDVLLEEYGYRSGEMWEGP